MKPSSAIIKNWANVIILPLDGSSLERNEINERCCKITNLQVRSQKNKRLCGK